VSRHSEREKFRVSSYGGQVNSRHHHPSAISRPVPGCEANRTEKTQDDCARSSSGNIDQLFSRSDQEKDYRVLPGLRERALQIGGDQTRRICIFCHRSNHQEEKRDIRKRRQTLSARPDRQQRSTSRLANENGDCIQPGRQREPRHAELRYDCELQRDKMPNEPLRRTLFERPVQRIDAPRVASIAIE